MDPDQTAPICVKKASKTLQQRTKADDFCCNWRFKG